LCVEEEHTIINVQSVSKFKGFPSCCSVLVQEPAFVGLYIAIFIFREEGEFGSLGIKL
jgi:hypothetical protein